MRFNRSVHVVTLEHTLQGETQAERKAELNRLLVITKCKINKLAYDTNSKVVMLSKEKRGRKIEFEFTIDEDRLMDRLIRVCENIEYEIKKSPEEIKRYENIFKKLL